MEEIQLQSLKGDRLATITAQIKKMGVDFATISSIMVAGDTVILVHVKAS